MNRPGFPESCSRVADRHGQKILALIVQVLELDRRDVPNRSEDPLGKSIVVGVAHASDLRLDACFG